MLRTRGLTRRFGGLVAVDHVDFELGGDELCSLIGPNGAGKTTFFNLLTGVLAPSDGAVELQTGDGWQDVTDADPAATARMGVHRSYQITNVFPTNTVLENVRVAAQAGATTGRSFHRNVNAFDGHYEEAWGILERVNLADEAHSMAQNLSHGAARQLEVAIAL